MRFNPSVRSKGNMHLRIRGTLHTTQSNQPPDQQRRPNLSLPQTTYPPRPTQRRSRLGRLDVPEASDGKILLRLWSINSWDDQDNDDQRDD
ncbi:hypothetical protein Pst134EA_009644 [Puccinia striiformis f. sp. tritici]|uniref:hypothetical protein n=1 Tax=Puccinia striiformis f. sp. tritici TaxID=168172 RepID=UPI002007A578|nr:hypothetical protein Pst134EA_009644 [Puccinia striiformis f. sp. tritici]KAH9458438.1 hypothetical protein Pst134EB_010741 [Puccinia striiformis f. sp. tritici]KAH9469115.1 hypothetical protein Pst134EA_009644 [Puccinia striiformis f. sp. tritici]